MDWNAFENKMRALNSSLSNPALFKTAFKATKTRHFFDSKTRYLQIAFNYDLANVYQILPQIPRDARIIVEAGTPFIKRTGMAGIRTIRSLWSGLLIADLKILDGAAGEVALAAESGANGVTIAGSAPPETIARGIVECKKRGIISMVDMLNVEDPLRVLVKAKAAPDVVVLHRGRDEEKSFGKVIAYKNIKRVKSKFNSLISVAGGVDLKESQSAAFNGANIVVVNLVDPSDPWSGIKTDGQITKMAREFLKTID